MSDLQGLLKLYKKPVLNDREGLTVAEDDLFFYDILMPPLWGVTLVMTPKGQRLFWSYGWKFEDFHRLKTSMEKWQPQTQNEPLGWVRRMGNAVRVAPYAEAEPWYNRLRCVHGGYQDELCSSDPSCGLHNG